MCFGDDVERVSIFDLMPAQSVTENVRGIFALALLSMVVTIPRCVVIWLCMIFQERAKGWGGEGALL